MRGGPGRRRRSFDGGCGRGGSRAQRVEPNILEPQFPLAFWTLIVFLLLMFVLWRFAWGPLSKALHDREHYMEDSLRQAEHARVGERAAAGRASSVDGAGQPAGGRACWMRPARGAISTAEEIRRTAQAEAETT